MFDFLLKYPLDYFLRGELVLQWSFAIYAFSVLIVAAVVAIGSGYFKKEIAPPTADRTALWALRTALLGLLLFVLLDPRLVVETDDPVQGHVAVLIDDSLSMRIPDMNGEARSKFILRAFTPGTGSLATEMEHRVDARYLKFSNHVEPIVRGEQLRFAGTSSNLGQALDSIARSPDIDSLAAVVVVTDGAFEYGPALEGAVQTLSALGIALHAIGVGSEKWSTDLEILAGPLPRRLLRGDKVEADVTVRHSGLAGRTVSLVAEEESVIVYEQPLILPADGQPVSLRVPLSFNEAGPRRIMFRIEPQADEIMAENNTDQRTVDVRGDPIRVLHVEGEPRFEVKFLRRAVSADDGIHLVSLIRTAEHKYYRLGIDDADELAKGLPGTEEAWFKYDAVVIGSIGNELLDEVQQARLREFVARRGGGLLMLGGRRAFSEGGYADSTLARLAPVVLPAEASAFRARIPVRPSSNSLGHPLLRLTDSNHENTSWERLPPLTVLNPIRRAKPGAVMLLEGRDSAGEPLVVLAWQRYGRGTVAAFPVLDSWRWQMHVDIPLEDQTHEHLWRNLLRHLARPAEGRLRLKAEPPIAAAGEKIFIEAEVLDADFHPLKDAIVTLEAISPDGEVKSLALERALNRDGFYQTSIVARALGRHEFRLKLDQENEDPIETQASVEVSGVGREFHSAQLDAQRLERIAANTGGRFLRAEDAEKIVLDIDDTTTTVRVERRLPLWDAPALLIALMGLACIEWVWRRRRGMA